MALNKEQVKRRLYEQGMTQKEWALKHGYHPSDVTRVLNGIWKGTRGKGHEIAVKLGLKDSVAA